MEMTTYNKAIQLLEECSTADGFLASAQKTANYNRVWARDGVICGLAALASGNENLINSFKNTLDTLAHHQHKNGTIPSNVSVIGNVAEVSYGGLAGRVDAVTWFIIGVCQYAHYKKEDAIIIQYESNIKKCLALLEAWEYNNQHLIYVPLSGNWADEYITDGYVLYDQLMRIWALRAYNHFKKSDEIDEKIRQILRQVEVNFTPNDCLPKYHERAYAEFQFKGYMPCSFSPAGYKTQLDAFANSLALMLNIGSNDFQKEIMTSLDSIVMEMELQLIPAFWPPIRETDNDWNLLKNNCKYSFRNFPYEFHNGGSWAMVNGFYGLALLMKNENERAATILSAINRANETEDFSFFENFNTKTMEPNGVAFCAWSAAATIFLHQSLTTNFKFLY